MAEKKKTEKGWPLFTHSAACSLAHFSALTCWSVHLHVLQLRAKVKPVFCSRIWYQPIWSVSILETIPIEYNMILVSSQNVNWIWVGPPLKVTFTSSHTTFMPTHIQRSVAPACLPGFREIIWSYHVPVLPLRAVFVEADLERLEQSCPSLVSFNISRPWS